MCEMCVPLSFDDPDDLLGDYRWDEIRDKLAEPGYKLIPAWFAQRMMSDSWDFGLLTVTGHIIVLETIDKITRDASGNIWIDASMRLTDAASYLPKIRGLMFAPTSRTYVSINAAHIVAAFELGDS